MYGYKWLHMVKEGVHGIYWRLSQARLLNVWFAARMQCSL